MNVWENEIISRVEQGISFVRFAHTSAYFALAICALVFAQIVRSVHRFW